jgi:MFS family permease
VGNRTLLSRIVCDGTRRQAVLLVIGAAFALAAVGEVALLVLTPDPDWGTGITSVLCAMAIAGLVVGLRWNPFDSLESRNRVRAAEQTSREGRRTALDLLLLDLVLVVLAFPLGVVVVVRDDDPTGWFLSLMFAFLSAIGLLLAWLVDMLVVLPVVTLVATLIGRTGRNRVAASLAAMLLAIVGFAIAVTFAVPSESHGYVGRGGRLVEAVGVLLGVPFREPASPALLWIARLALVLVVASMVWFAREGRAARRR